jgi:hypothetical protein
MTCWKVGQVEAHVAETRHGGHCVAKGVQEGCMHLLRDSQQLACVLSSLHKKVIRRVKA